MTSKVSIRRATAADAIAFHGKLPILSMRGWVAELDGKLIGIWGLCYESGIPVAFSEIKDEFRAYPKDIIRGIRLLAEMMDKYKGPVYAVADPDETTSAGLLAHYGWVPTGRTCALGDLLIREK